MQSGKDTYAYKSGFTSHYDIKDVHVTSNMIAQHVFMKQLRTRNVSTVHRCPRCGVPDYKTAKFYLVQMP